MTDSASMPLTEWLHMKQLQGAVVHVCVRILLVPCSHGHTACIRTTPTSSLPGEEVHVHVGAAIHVDSGPGLKTGKCAY